MYSDFMPPAPARQHDCARRATVFQLRQNGLICVWVLLVKSRATAKPPHAGAYRAQPSITTTPAARINLEIGEIASQDEAVILKNRHDAQRANLPARQLHRRRHASGHFRHVFWQRAQGLRVVVIHRFSIEHAADKIVEVGSARNY